MKRVPFLKQLEQRWHAHDTLLCVGLDPDIKRLPPSVGSGPGAFLSFCRAIVDATAPFVCAFKPQIAYFAAEGRETELEQLIDHIHDAHPGIPVILDAKRGDIGDTARLYAQEAFERYDADAVTVSPYLGKESIEPYFAWPDRGVVLLCRTSNPGSAWLQEYPPEAPVFERVAAGAREWNQHGNLMLVAGATYPEDLGRIRGLVGDMPLLVPGIGAQGGDLHEVLSHGLTATRDGLVINLSRAVLYASDGPDFAAAAARSAEAFCAAVRGFHAV
ncbi:MAG: orotidine-5'-phosphate decarboxylase [Pseudomonadales bacterium]